MLIVQAEATEKNPQVSTAPRKCVCVPVVGDFSELPVLSFNSELSEGKDTKSMGCQAVLAEFPFGTAAEQDSEDKVLKLTA